MCLLLLALAFSGSGAAEPPETLWTQTYGGSNIDIGHCVRQTTDGGYIITGYTRSFGATSGRNVWLIKTDAAGTEVWTNTFGGNNDDEGHAVGQTADGGYVMTGWTFSYGSGYLGNAWLVKTDALGHQQWHRHFGGSGVDRGYSVQQTPDGGYIIAGYTDSFGAGLYDMLLIKTDASGNQDWLKTFGGSGRDYGHSVAQTNDGGYIVAGYTLSYGAGGDDVWLVKTDKNGVEEWSKTYGGSSSDVAYCIQKTTDGGFIVTGHTLSYGAGLHDIWLIRLAGEATGFGDIPTLALHQNHPNPFNPITTIRYALPADSNVKLAIYDVRGRVVRALVDARLKAGDHSIVWDGRDDAGRMVVSGVYVYRIRADGWDRTRKMVFAK